MSQPCRSAASLHLMGEPLGSLRPFLYNCVSDSFQIPTSPTASDTTPAPQPHTARGSPFFAHRVPQGSSLSSTARTPTGLRPAPRLPTPCLPPHRQTPDRWRNTLCSVRLPWIPWKRRCVCMYPPSYLRGLSLSHDL